MDPLTLAGTFATLVGLLANFKAERSGADLSDFMNWLRDQHQEALATAILGNARIQTELATLLATNHDDVVARLKSITDRLALIAQSVEGFGQLARLVSNSPLLSDQAWSVLQQMACSSAKFVMEHQTLHGPAEYLFMDGGTGVIQVDEPRFIDEDFQSLVDCGYLRVDPTSKGTRRYYITRAGAQAGSNR